MPSIRCREHRPVIIIHSLDDAKAALAAAGAEDIAVTLRSAPGAAAYLGAPVFREMVAAALAAHPGVRFTAVLDCGADPGLALAAFRQGVARVRLDVPAEVRARVADIARQLDAELDDDTGPAFDLLDCPQPVVALQKWLREARKSPPSEE